MEQLNRFHLSPGLDPDRNHARRGVALLLVLGSLVFIAALILAFLAGGGSEVKVSTTYSEGGRVSLLAQTAVNLVEAEVLDATKGQDAGGNDLAWASQPGMLRTYDASGALAKYYKLYSSPKMVGSPAGGDDAPLASAAKDLAAAWYQSPAFYTDLNEPVTISGVDHYPILDGNLAGSGGVYTFPTGGAIPGIAPDGSSVNNPPLNPAPGPGPATKAPFPVQWLYVLQNGEVTAPQTGTGSTATVSDASPANPIVGRIAFWTDDESGKVNVNTASEGVYSDTPRVASTYDVKLATQPPAHNEFQRYPGHPATTSLSAVFGSLLPVPAPGAVTSDAPFAPYYALAPKVADGGSQSGTAVATGGIVPDSDRLYASVDELMFQADRSVQPKLNPAAVEQARFFVTAHSRSPDVNLFNRPRVGIWPVNASDTPQTRTALDELIAFTTTVNKVPYYFQRSDWKATNELSLGNNQKLKDYLKALCGRAIPGFGGNFAAKYGATNGKATELDQILTEIFDYVRCTNIYDVSGGTGFTPFTPVPSTTGSSVSGEVVPTLDAGTGTKGFGRFPTIAKAGLLFIAAEDGDIDAVTTPAPAHPLPAKTVRVQAALVFQLFDPAQGYPGLYPQCTLKVTGSTLKWDHGPNGGLMFSPGSLSTYQGDFGGTRHWGGVLGFGLLRNTANGNTLSDAMWGGPGDPLITQIDAADPPDYLKTGQIHLQPGGQVTVEVSLNGGTAVQTITFNFPEGLFPVPTEPAVHTYTDPLHGNTYDCTKMANRLAPQGYYNDRRATVYFFNPNDTFESLQSPTGDYRLSAARAVISGTEAAYQFVQHPHWGNQFAHSFMEGDGSPLYYCEVGQLTGIADGYWDSGNTPTSTTLPRLYKTNIAQPYNLAAATLTCVTPDGLPIAQNGTQAGSTANFAAGKPFGDFDNGTGNVMDGAYINKVDEGAASAPSIPAYYSNGFADPALLTAAYFSPNRQVPSAVMFGSLPTGVIATANGTPEPWQTLLFHPDASHLHRGNGTPASGPPFTTPPDELLLDLFTMPVVEPYAISEPLSTAGRVNMNTQIVPFTYINRDTGVRAVLKSERLLAIPNKYANALVGPTKVYKQLDLSNTSYKNYAVPDFRFDLNVPETMKGLQARFDAGDLFRSAAEICSVDLIPNDTGDGNAAYSATGASMQTYWENHRLTGDNSRERPYADVYPRLTTKSNSFTIHFRVQALKKAGAGTDTQWREGTDLVTAEYRGSRLVERYVDPANANIPDYTDPLQTTPLSSFYRFRTVESKQFPP